jgi:hypothetical protein
MSFAMGHVKHTATDSSQQQHNTQWTVQPLIRQHTEHYSMQHTVHS